MPYLCLWFDCYPHIVSFLFWCLSPSQISLFPCSIILHGAAPHDSAGFLFQTEIIKFNFWSNVEITVAIIIVLYQKSLRGGLPNLFKIVNQFSILQATGPQIRKQPAIKFDFSLYLLFLMLLVDWVLHNQRFKYRSCTTDPIKRKQACFVAM